MSDTDRILSIEQVQRLRNFFSGTDEDDQIAAVPQHMFIELLDSHDAQQREIKRLRARLEQIGGLE